jgi:hypothetical protein
MTLLKVAEFHAVFAYRHGAERELWIANLEKKEKLISSSVFEDDIGDPVFYKSPLEPCDWKYTDWSIFPSGAEEQ